MKYFFILGNHPALSLAELDSRLSLESSSYLFPDILLGETKVPLILPDLLKTIGGTIKAGVIKTRVPVRSSAIFETSLKILESTPKQGKFNFGISSYGPKGVDSRKIGLALKQELKNQGISCRLVVSKEKTLSSVVVEQNKLLRSGKELVYIYTGNQLLIGTTEAVQPFKDLSLRDYGRPARDDRSGMLPPKLAEIMLNLGGSHIREIILDPFCGSGTIITEAMLLGYQHIYGSDITKKAVADTEKNISWIQKKYNLPTQPQISVSDARELLRTHKKKSVRTIVTEVYLGPQRGQFNIEKVSKELEVLYGRVIQIFSELLIPGGRAVLALPAFMIKNHPTLLALSFRPLKIVNILSSFKHIPGVTKRQTLLYGRPGQKVWREIVVLEK